jgi:hypothetical protein
MQLGIVGDLARLSPLPLSFIYIGTWPAWLRGLAYLLLVFTSGAWISFGFSLKDVSFWIRICIAIILSPTIVCAEFYALRLPGVPFPTSVALIVLLNLPALYLVWRRSRNSSQRQPPDWLVGAIVVLLPIVCMASVLSYMDAQIYSGASWLHADPVYMFVRGDLIPEAPTLAGIRMSYPVWSGLVFETIHSYLTQSPPQTTYVWSNLFLLIAVCGLASGVAKELGGGRVARVTAPIFLLLGTNPVGYILVHLLPLHRFPQIWGDERYTPWVNKFMLFGPMTMGIALTMAIVYLLIRPGSLRRDVFIVLGLLLCSIGLFYPLLFPSACGVVCARALADLTDAQGWKAHSREVIALAAVVFFACLLTYAEVRFMTSARHNSTGEVLFSTLPGAAKKLFAAFIATALPLAGLAICFRPLWRSHRRAITMLLGGAAASYLLYAVFFIPFYTNEYKFIFTAAMCLAVFPALAIEKVWIEWPKIRAITALILLLLLPLGAYAHWAYSNWPAPWLGAHATSASYPQTYNPPLDTTGDSLQLNRQDERFGICNAVRTMTPAQSVLLVDNSAIYYPGLTNRSVYVSAQNRSYPGVNLWADTLDIEVGGYGSQILADRRSIQNQFFESKDSSLRNNALQRIQDLKRPIAVIVDLAHPDLFDWLTTNKAARKLFQENGLSLWLIDNLETHQ